VGVLLPYRIWQRSVFSDYNDMADNKAYLSQLPAVLDTFLEGTKVRVNTFKSSYKGGQVLRL
jgi:hypothetical protein